MRVRIITLSLAVAMALAMVPAAATSVTPALNTSESISGLDRADSADVTYQLRRTAAGVETTMRRRGLSGLPDQFDAAALRRAWLEDIEDGSDSEEVELDVEDGSEESLYPAPDLDGDGRKDVVAVRYGDRTITFRGLKGRTGTQLWEHSQPGDFGFTRSALLGPDADQGLLLMSATFDYDMDSSGNEEFSISLSITAMAGGPEPLWHRTFEGGGQSSDLGTVFHGVTFPAGSGQLSSSAATDIALVTSDGHAGLVPSMSTQVAVLDGADGSTTPIVQSTGDGWDVAGVVGDVDGDRLQDIVLASTQPDGDLLVTAYSAGARLPQWSQRVATGPALWLTAGGDPDGDGVDDVLITSFSQERFSGDVTLLGGASGTLHWTRPGDVAAGVRDLDGDGLDDIVIQGIVDGFNSRRFGVRYTARRVDGTRIYRRSYAVRWPRGGDGGFASVGLWGLIGDVDRDRRPDMAHEVEMFSSNGEVRRDRGIVRAASGVKALSGPVGAPLYASVDGRGDDIATFRWARGALRLRVLDGRNGDVIWRRPLRLDGRRPGYVEIHAVDVNRDRHAELLVSAHGRDGSQVYVLNGRNGRVLWGRQPGVDRTAQSS